MLPRLLFLVLLLLPQWGLAASVIAIGGDEHGQKTTGQQEIWYDPHNDQSADAAAEAYRDGAFVPLKTAGSTGLQPGAVWSHFVLHNVTGQKQTLYLEYVDHQLIALDAFMQMDGSQGQRYYPIAELSLANPFDARPINHNRFVFAVELAPSQSRALLVKFSSDRAGFVFPALRIWSPKQLQASHTLETSVVAFLFGGIFLMSLLSLVAGIATGDRSFYSYGIYALTKIVSWSTILGYTHQFLVRHDFHWNLMSFSGGLGILFGLIFARSFLQTRIFARKLDYVLLFMMANAVFLLLTALLKLTDASVLSITLALLLYPVIPIAALVRWRQGSLEAAIFALAWSVLVVALVFQALRDLGLVAHNFLNYYWPVSASFFEMVAIMAAMGMRVRRLQQQKDSAEQRYLTQLETSRTELEKQVWERTRELEKARLEAEQEARTDPLTGIYNRRSFFIEAGKRFKLAHRKRQPLSLMMFDIDYFKSINDQFGHSMGDEALRQFSQTIADSLRDSDVFGRLGGEEFAVVLSEDRQGTLQTAQRLREAIAQISIATPTGELQLTASIGIAYLDEEVDVEELLYKADHALYQAKHKGRDQIIEHTAN